MATPYNDHNDFIDSKTEDGNHQREETKRGILYQSTFVHNVPEALEAMKSENEHENFDVEGDVVKFELKVDSDSESGPEVCKTISAEDEVLNVGKTAKGVEIKSIKGHHIGFSVKKSQDYLDCNEEHISDVVTRKSGNKNEYVKFKRNGKIFQCDICSKTFKCNSSF